MLTRLSHRNYPALSGSTAKEAALTQRPGPEAKKGQSRGSRRPGHRGLSRGNVLSTYSSVKASSGNEKAKTHRGLNKHNTLSKNDMIQGTQKRIMSPPSPPSVKVYVNQGTLADGQDIHFIPDLLAPGEAQPSRLLQDAGS